MVLGTVSYAASAVTGSLCATRCGCGWAIGIGDGGYYFAGIVEELRRCTVDRPFASDDCQPQLVPRLYKGEVEAKMRQLEAQGDRSLKLSSAGYARKVVGCAWPWGLGKF